MTPLRLLRIARLRWKSFVHPARLDAEFDRELAFHFDQLIHENTAQGLPPADARRAAARALGNLALAKESSRDHRRARWLHDLWQDTGYAWRRLKGGPLFATIAVGSLALGVGANTAVLAAMHTMLWRPLPLPHADRLTVVETRDVATGAIRTNATLGEYRAWRAGNHTFETIEASFGGARDFGAATDDVLAERIESRAVTSGWLAVLGARPLLGRFFTDDEYRFGHQSRVMVISDRLWEDRYGRDPDILRRVEHVNGVNMAIVGVMSSEFQYQDRRVQCWFPLQLNPQSDGPGRLFALIGRLKDGVTVNTAQADLASIKSDANVRPIADALYGWARTSLRTLAIAVALVLLVACANVATLILARNAERRPEMAMRLALGASRGRIVRQLLAEQLVLSSAAGAVGLLVAWAGLRVLVIVMSPPIGAPRFAVTSLTVGLSVALFLGSLAAGALAGLLPALAGSIAGKGAPRQTNPRASRFVLRGSLVVGQVAIAVVLLTSAGLLLQSYVRLHFRDLPFDERNLTSFQFRVTGPAPVVTMRRIETALQGIPGVDAVSGISDPPLNSLAIPNVAIGRADGSTAIRDATVDLDEAKYFLVTPGFFSTMRTTMLRGREFTDAEGPSAPRAVVLNQRAASLLWPGEDAIGKRLVVQDKDTRSWREVVGIVPNLPLNRGQVAVPPVVYASYLQEPAVAPSLFAGITQRMTFVVRYHDRTPETLALSAQRAAAAIEPSRPLAFTGPVGAIGIPMRERLNYALALALLGAVAAVLAAIGIYGVLAADVQRRTREIGVRVALGATARQVWRLMARPAAAMIAPGLAIGIAGAVAVPRLMASQLWGVRPVDPPTLAAAFAVTILIGAAACVCPIRRAAAIDPAVTLRAE